MRKKAEQHTNPIMPIILNFSREEKKQAIIDAMLSAFKEVAEDAWLECDAIDPEHDNFTDYWNQKLEL